MISTNDGVLVILHCVWCPRSKKQTGRFFLWAESSIRNGNLEKGSRTLAANHLPYQASSSDLLEVLRSVVPGKLEGARNIGALSLLMPTVGEAEPLASSPRISETNAAALQNSTVKLAPWTVEGFDLSVEDAVSLLTSVSAAHSAREPSDVGQSRRVTSMVGADVLFWSKAAKLLLDLLVRQRFVPYLENSGDGDRSGPLSRPLDAPSDRERRPRPRAPLGRVHASGLQGRRRTRPIPPC